MTESSIFSDATKQAIRLRASGRCECTRSDCQHYGACKAPGTEFHQRTALVEGTDEMRAGQLLCKACHHKAHEASGALGRM